MIWSDRHKLRLLVLVPQVLMGIWFWIGHGHHSQEWTASAIAFYGALYMADLLLWLGRRRPWVR